MVKYLLAAILCGLSFIACDDDTPKSKDDPGKEDPWKPWHPESRLLHSYVPCYVDGEWTAAWSGVKAGLSLFFQEEGSTLFFSSDVSRKNDQGAAEFQRLAARNGDTSYDKEEDFFSYHARYSYVHNLRALHVVCTSGGLGCASSVGKPAR